MTEESRLPPHSIEAEEAVIGSLLIDGAAIKDIDLEPAAFYHGPLGTIYKCCLALKERRVGINQITLAQELDRTGKLESCGGVAYLCHLISLVPSSLDIQEYATIVQMLHGHRTLIHMGQQLIEQGYKADPAVAPVDIVAELSAAYQRKYRRFEKLVSPKQQADELLEMHDEYMSPNVNAIKWGFRNLDNIMGGLYPGELTIIGARPSVGKTQLLLDVAEYIEQQGKTILFVSAEMITRHLLERKVSRLLGKDVLDLRHGRISEDELRKIMELAGQVSENNTYMLPQGVSSRDIYSKATKLKETVGLDIVLIDYLQKLADCYGTGENQNIRVGRACKVLTEVATELKIPVVCASQLNRGIEHRSDGFPTLADLRDSGSIEQDAFNVLLAWRYMGPEVTHDGGVTDPAVLRIQVAKGRQTGTGMAKLVWLAGQHRYADLAQ